MYKPTKLQRLIWNVVTNGPNYAALTFTDRNIKRRQNGSVIEWDSHTHVLHVQDPSIAPTWYVDTQFLLRQIRQKLRVSAVHGSENIKKKKKNYRAVAIQMITKFTGVISPLHKAQLNVTFGKPVYNT